MSFKQFEMICLSLLALKLQRFMFNLDKQRRMPNVIGYGLYNLIGYKTL